MTVNEVIALIAAITSAVTSIGAVAIGFYNSQRIHDVHTAVNSQSVANNALAEATGVAKGIASQLNVERGIAGATSPTPSARHPEV